VQHIPVKFNYCQNKKKRDVKAQKRVTEELQRNWRNWIIFRQQVSEVRISHNSYSPTTTPIYDEPMIVKDLTDFINHDYLYSWSKDVDEFLDASDIFLRCIKSTTSNTSNNEEKTSQTPETT
jgi:hypothetical protein